MIVVERRERTGSRDQFPVGMRVLAVDDDPTCLKVLESLLLRCQYHVTMTNQAREALDMLRENKEQFDLVISDVHMPDMDGFKLLELVGLEMDLPVIMLSANGETQAVMKGITHGACDYLLKPVRIEELRNIWQHVIRRKKFDSRDQNNWDECDRNQLADSEGVQGLGNGSSDRNAKLNKKRRDQDDEDDGEDNMNENDDPSAQKRPRVVWSVELHRKFVAAINQLGIDKAVPKRILDLMNVEKLTRENVASHRKKYRLYLKRLSAVANQQANMVVALRGRDPSYLPVGSLDGYTNFNSLVSSRPLSGRTTFQSNGSLPRMNSFNGFGLHGLVPAGTAQPGRTLSNTNGSINDSGKLHGVGLSTLQGNQQGTLIQGLQQSKSAQEASSCLLGGFSSSGVAIVAATKSPHMQQGNQLQTQSFGLCGQVSVRTPPPPLSSDPFEIGIGSSSHPADLHRCNEIWQGAVPSTSYPTNTLPMDLPFGHSGTSSGNIRDNISPMVSQLGIDAHSNASSSSVVMAVRNGNLSNVHYQANRLVATTGVNADAILLNFRSLGNSNLKWEDPRHGQNQNQNPNLTYNSSSSFSVSSIHMTRQNERNQKLSSGFSNQKMDMPMINQTNVGALLPTHDSRSNKTTAISRLPYKDEPSFEDAKLPGGFSSGGFGLNDLEGNPLIKPMDNVISHAQAILGSLVMQRSTFSGIGSKLTNVSSRLPTVNHILSSIKRKKSMDTIILSLVASVLFIILIYWLSK